MSGPDLTATLGNAIAASLVDAVADAVVERLTAREATAEERITPNRVRALARVRMEKVQAALDSGVLPSVKAGPGPAGKGPRRLIRRGDAVAWRDAGCPTGGAL